MKTYHKFRFFPARLRSARSEARTHRKPGRKKVFFLDPLGIVIFKGFKALFIVTVTSISSFCVLKSGFFGTLKKGAVFQGERGSTACESGLPD